MLESNHPELQALQELMLRHKVSISLLENDVLDGSAFYPAVVISIASRVFKMYVEDEYEDFKINHPVLSFYLVLRELEIYKDEDDFLTWCTSQSVNPASSQVLSYYRNLSSTCTEIEGVLGKIDSQISSMDYELNAGAIQKLRL